MHSIFLNMEYLWRIRLSCLIMCVFHILEYGILMNLSPQDVVVVLKLLHAGYRHWTYAQLGVELALSQSQEFRSVERAEGFPGSTRMCRRQPAGSPHSRNCWRLSRPFATSGHGREREQSSNLPRGSLIGEAIAKPECQSASLSGAKACSVARSNCFC